MQIAAAAQNNQLKKIRQILIAAAAQHDNVLSMALRTSDGRILAATGEHERRWVEPHDHRSTPEFVQVQLKSDGQVWGKLEIAFAPYDIFIPGVPSDTLPLLIYVAFAGFVGYYFVLRRSLRELDPGNVIPERVKSAFNALSEGVVILDQRGAILLSNDAFGAAIGSSDGNSYLGAALIG